MCIIMCQTCFWDRLAFFIKSAVTSEAEFHNHSDVNKQQSRYSRCGKIHDHILSENIILIKLKFGMMDFCANPPTWGRTPGRERLSGANNSTFLFPELQRWWTCLRREQRCSHGPKRTFHTLHVTLNSIPGAHFFPQPQYFNNTHRINATLMFWKHNTQHASH